jgi:hypothetical protein
MLTFKLRPEADMRTRLTALFPTHEISSQIVPALVVHADKTVDEWGLIAFYLSAVDQFVAKRRVQKKIYRHLLMAKAGEVFVAMAVETYDAARTERYLREASE